MKKHILFFTCLLFVGMAFWSCDRGPEPPKLYVSEIELLVPEDGKVYDLAATNNISFAWEEAFVVESYEIVFSASPQLATPVVTVPAGRNPTLLSAISLNETAETLGLEAGKKGKLYWSVRSAKSSQPSTAAVRSLEVTLIPPPLAQLLAPANGTVVQLNHDTPVAEVSFEWEFVDGVNSYSLVISKNANLSDPFIDETVEADFKTLTYAELQTYLEDASNGLKLFKTNTLYWNVRFGSEFMAISPRTLKLSGQRIFTDVRGDESITYKVAVLPYPDGDETVWMAENLRATKLRDGTDLVYKGAADNDSQYIPGSEALINATTPVNEVLGRLAGVYYKVNMIGDNSSSVVWPGLLAPDGWKVPTEQEFADLGAAAGQISQLLEVLRSPEAYPGQWANAADMERDKLNLWEMNMAGCGTNREATPSPYVYDFGGLNAEHMFYAFNSVSKCVTVTYNPWSNLGTRAIGAGATSPLCVRLIYTGDDN